MLCRILIIGSSVGLSMITASAFAPTFFLFTFLFAVGFGICNGLTYMVATQHGWLWFPDKPGLVSGIIISGFGFGNLIFGNFATYLVNPDNEAAIDGSYPESVNSKVPKMILILAICFIMIACIATLLIFEGPNPASIKEAAKVVSDMISQEENINDPRLNTFLTRNT